MDNNAFLYEMMFIFQDFLLRINTFLKNFTLESNFLSYIFFSLKKGGHEALNRQAKGGKKGGRRGKTYNAKTKLLLKSITIN